MGNLAPAYGPPNALRYLSIELRACAFMAQTAIAMDNTIAAFGLYKRDVPFGNT